MTAHTQDNHFSHVILTSLYFIIVIFTDAQGWLKTSMRWYPPNKIENEVCCYSSFKPPLKFILCYSQSILDSYLFLCVYRSGNPTDLPIFNLEADSGSTRWVWFGLKLHSHCVAIAQIWAELLLGKEHWWVIRLVTFGSPFKAQGCHCLITGILLPLGPCLSEWVPYISSPFSSR